MLPLISVVLVILGALGIKRLLPRNRKRRRQVRFIRETLAANRKFDNRRVIASLSTVPDRINNLRPTIQSLLKQTRPPDEIVLAIPEFSIREQRPYVVPEYLLRLPRVRVLRCREDWGPATKFIGAIQDEDGRINPRASEVARTVAGERATHVRKWKRRGSVTPPYINPHLF